MEIKAVQLIHLKEVKPGLDDNGVAIVPQAETFSFAATLADGTEITVPNEPLNRHYVEIANWYKDQKKKPFKFDFK